MRSLRGFLIRLAGLFRKGRHERELAQEFESHFQMHVEDNLRRGMSAAQAWREARLKFGGIDRAKESMREGATIMTLETTWQDLRYAIRGMRRNPGFAATAILSLALGIGASVAIFTLADNLLLRPLPYRQPGQLMMVWEVNPHRKGTNRNVVSPANYRDWKAQNNVFESMAVFGEGRAAFADGARVEELEEQYMRSAFEPRAVNRVGSDCPLGKWRRLFAQLKYGGSASPSPIEPIRNRRALKWHLDRTESPKPPG